MAARRNVLVVGHDNNDDNDESPHSLSSTPCVLILGGWSPGPLLYLTRYLRQQKHSTKKSIQLLQPSLIMPPMGISWCTNIPFVLLMTLTLGFGWYAFTTCQRIYQQNGAGASASVQYYQSILQFTIMGLVWMRALVGHVVKHAIKHNMRICQRLLAEHNIVMVIGFSWGAAMGAELIAQGLLEQSSSSSESSSSGTSSSSKLPMIPSLLIAPTTSLIAQCSLPPFRTDAAYRVQRKVWRTRRRNINQTTNESSNSPPLQNNNNNKNNHLPMVHVVHAYGDDCFCPHPERWREEQETNGASDDDNSGDAPDTPAVQLTMLEDNHVFLHPHSQRQLIQIVDGMMRSAVAL